MYSPIEEMKKTNKGVGRASIARRRPASGGEEDGWNREEKYKQTQSHI